MMDNGLKIKLMGLEFINGMMEENTQDNGKITICTVRVFFHGLTAVDIKESL